MGRPYPNPLDEYELLDDDLDDVFRMRKRKSPWAKYLDKSKKTVSEQPTMPKPKNTVSEQPTQPTKPQKRSLPSSDPGGRAKKHKPSPSPALPDPPPPAKNPTEQHPQQIPGGGAVNKDGEEFWEISGKRRVTIGSYAGCRMINIREYYHTKEGEWLPTKKGVSLTMEQFNALVSFLPHLETVLVDKYGEKDLTRPDYSTRDGNGDAGKSKEPSVEDTVEEEVGIDAGAAKKNFEETSDEE